jgi:hypothetical protein
MIAGLSSSLALAQRTAAKARVTMDTMSRQIATGQKVASVKDDGAAWARAAGMKSQKVEWSDRARMADRLELGVKHTAAVAEAHLDITQRLREIIVSARGLPAGSRARQDLQAAWNALVESGRQTGGGVNATFADNTGYGTDALGSGVRVDQTDSYWANTRFAVYSQTNDWQGHYDLVAPVWGINVAMSAVDIAGGSAAQLQTAYDSVTILVGDTLYGTQWNSGWLQQGGADLALLEDKRADIARNEDRLDAAIGSLTDADLGKASTARAQAETRQQLALSTISQAISAYGAFAGGLLANAQRTQRSVLA